MDESDLDETYDETAGSGEISDNQNSESELSSGSGMFINRNGANQFYQEKLENDSFKTPFAAVGAQAAEQWPPDQSLRARGAPLCGEPSTEFSSSLIASSTDHVRSKLQNPSPQLDPEENVSSTDSNTLDHEIEKRLFALRVNSFNTQKIKEEDDEFKLIQFKREDERDSELKTEKYEIVNHSLFDDNFVNSKKAKNMELQTENILNYSDGHSLHSSASSHSLSRSYVYSSASVDSSRPIPDPRSDGYGEKQILVPKYKLDGSGYCWPTDKLPLGGNLRFDENIQWITRGSPIGEGATGECHIATITDDDSNIFCVKKVGQSKYNREEVFSLYLSGKDQNEAKLLLSSGSKNIVPFYGATYWRKDVRIFMELMQGGTVEELLKEEFKDGLPKHYYLWYLADVLSALNFLHGKGIVHRDVKSANVLLDFSRLHAKLADFGNASPLYENESTRTDDIWAAGCFLLEMIGNWCDNEVLTRPYLTSLSESRSLPTHNDKDTNDVLQLFFSNNQKNAKAIFDEVSKRKLTRTVSDEQTNK